MQLSPKPNSGYELRCCLLKVRTKAIYYKTTSIQTITLSELKTVLLKTVLLRLMAYSDWYVYDKIET